MSSGRKVQPVNALSGTGVRFSILDEVTVWKGSGKYVIQADTGKIANSLLVKE
jgi:hypothetical protein